MYKSCFLRGYQAHGNYSVPFAKLLIFMSNIFSEYIYCMEFICQSIDTRKYIPHFSFSKKNNFFRESMDMSLSFFDGVNKRVCPNRVGQTLSLYYLLLLILNARVLFNNEFFTVCNIYTCW
jgi:hypothetical protein